MDLALSPEQEQLVAAFAGLYGREATTERVRKAEPSGFDRSLWERLLELGVVAMAVDEDRGGWGASPEDLSLVAEQQGRFLAPAPVIEAQVAARLLARLPGEAAATALTATLSGERLVTLGLHPGGALVPAAAVADDAVLLADDGERLLLVPLAGAGVRQVVENMGSLPLADVALPRAPGAPGAADAVVLATGPDALVAHDAAIDDWLRLTAAALVGIGARGLEIGVEYVKERHAWGVPIGSFQAVAHPLADSAAAVDGARLLAYEAAWAATEDPGRAGELAALAFAYAYESARDATYRSLHFHGGYGFMLEYDIQLYYRRARAWANVYASPATAYRRAADKRYGRRDGRSS